MSTFAIFLYTVLVVVLGYMIGHNTGYDEGNLDARAELLGKR